MSETRHLSRVRITHEMLTEMVRRTLVVRDSWAEIRDLTVVGTGQTQSQLFAGTVEIFLESPEFRPTAPGADLYIMHADLKDDKP